MIITQEQKNELFDGAFYYRQLWLDCLELNDKSKADIAYAKRLAYLMVLDTLCLSAEYDQYELNQLAEENQ